MRQILLSIFPGFLLGLIGSLVGGWIAHCFAERRRRKEEFNKVAAEFRNAFLPEILYLENNVRIKGTGSSDNTGEFLRTGYVHRHALAYTTFRFYLPRCKRCRFDETWKEYCGCIYGNPDKDTALQFINLVLSFADVH